YLRVYASGKPDVVGALTAEEHNLLQARRLAISHGRWDALVKTMQGLRVLYEATARNAEWARLVDEVLPYFLDPATDDPLPGCEEQWNLVTDYRARLARDARLWPEAERLQIKVTVWNRQCATIASADTNAERTLA